MRETPIDSPSSSDGPRAPHRAGQAAFVYKLIAIGCIEKRFVALAAEGRAC
jgi:hypothetical protein